MLLKLVVLSAVVAAVSAKSFPLSKQNEDFDFQCPDGETLSKLRFKTPGKQDVRVQVFCRKVGTGQQAMAVNNPRLTEEFTLFEIGVFEDNLSIGSPSNCRDGEIVTGMKSRMEGTKRIAQLRCSTVTNADIDEELGCHAVGIFDPVTDGDNIVATVLPTEGCPTDGLTAISMSRQGIALKLCPFRVKSGKYNEECKTVREEQHLVNVARDETDLDKAIAEHGAANAGATTESKPKSKSKSKSNSKSKKPK